MTLSPALTYLIEYLDLPEATGLPDARWEAFQLAHLNNVSLFSIENKARQVGWSWLAAAEAVAVSCCEKRSTSIFVSINQDEAGEKIRYAKAIVEALDADIRPKLITDNRMEIEFENGSRLISHPCRPVRGKARARVYLDEFAHYPNDKEIYQSALPVISKGGAIRIGSSPLGAQGLFWEIFAQSTERRYPGYWRKAIPWWAVKAMCRDVRIAMRVAPGLTTDTRVRTFGTERLIQIYENMLLEDFQQEYECLWVDEAVAWIDWELIKRNQALAAEDRLWYRKVSGVDAAMAAIDEVAYQVTNGRIEDVQVGAMDIGRKHDKSEIIVTGKTTTGQLPYRLGITLDRVEFLAQESVVNKLLDTLPVSLFLIDQTGIGMQLAENMHSRHGDKCQGVTFTADLKALWAVEIKLKMQKGDLPIPLERDLSYQIHSIKRKVTAAKNVVYDTAANEAHHADMFWSLALTTWAGRQENMTGATVGANPLAGYRG